MNRLLSLPAVNRRGFPEVRVMAFLWVTNAEAGLEEPEEKTEADPTP